MRELIRAAWVIGRRDYVATVFSKTFALFLIGPLLPLIFGGVFSIIGISGDSGPGPAPTVVAIADGDIARTLAAAHKRVEAPDSLRIEPPTGDLHAQTRRLLDGGDAAVLTGGLDRPQLTGASDALDHLTPDVGTLVDEARDLRALDAQGGAPTKVAVARRAVTAAAPPPRKQTGADTARTGQFVLVFLTMLLCGMLLSNLLEEKSNKVIEILAAAVPVDAIFLGKLVAMLAMSLTGIVCWSAIGVGLYELISHQGLWPQDFTLDTPAVGWPLFALLGVLYFSASYLLLGAVFLGIGAQAKSVREVQTLSMPITMGQLLVFAFASAGVGRPNGHTAIAATIFPWSSPFEMFARAAELPTLWPHLIGLAWQALWIAIAIRISSGLFRRSVLNSAPFVGRSVRT